MPDAELLHSTVHGVAAAAKHDRAPNHTPLRALGSIANKNLELWRRNPQAICAFASAILIRTEHIHRDLPAETADAVDRLVRLLRTLAPI